MELLSVSESYRVTLRAKYLPVTNHRGSRIKVSRYENSIHGRDPQTVTVSWDYSLDTGANYAAAIAEYVRRANWGGKWVSSMIDGGAVGVCVDAVKVGA
jgi:hypothetical protein